MKFVVAAECSSKLTVHTSDTLSRPDILSPTYGCTNPCSTHVHVHLNGKTHFPTLSPHSIIIPILIIYSFAKNRTKKRSKRAELYSTPLHNAQTHVRLILKFLDNAESLKFFK